MAWFRGIDCEPKNRKTEVNDMQLSSRCYGLTGLTHADYFSVNAGFIVGNQETVIIDAGYNVEAAQTIYGYAKAVAPVNKISHVILLEGHYDHILGTSYFVEQGAQTVAHPSVTLNQQEVDKLKREANDELPFERRRGNKEAYLYFEGVKPFAPEGKVTEDTSLAIEGIDIEIYLAPGHTEENLLVFERNDKVAYVADTIYSGYLPTFAFGNRDLWEKWLKSLDLIESLNPNVLVPGHGCILRGADIEEEIRRHRQMLMHCLSHS